jgi:hypothetical protein
MRKLIASVTALLVLAAQPVFADQLKEDSTTTWNQCKEKGPYDNVDHFKRKGKTIWLRCGKKGKKGWGYRHIVEEHGGWTGIKGYATRLTLKKGKETKQSPGSFRYDYKVVEMPGDPFKWRVVVQYSKNWPGEPKPKHIITSFLKEWANGNVRATGRQISSSHV